MASRTGLSHIVSTMGDLQDWVRMQDDHKFEGLPEGIVSVSCTHNLLRKEMKELRLDLHGSVATLKDKLYRHCGTMPNHMALVLKSDGKVICELDDDDKMLGYYGVQSGMEIKIVDQNPHSLAKGGGLEDVSLVKKYVMTDAEYDRREDSVRTFKKKKLKEDPKFRFFPKNQGNNGETKEKRAPASATDVEKMKVGDRCEISPGARRGKIGFVGEVIFAVGHWVGVVLDEPLGRNDGTVKGKRYMECPARRGVFVDPRNVVAGDFPEVSFDDELSSSDEEL